MRFAPKGSAIAIALCMSFTAVAQEAPASDAETAADTIVETVAEVSEETAELAAGDAKAVVEEASAEVEAPAEVEAVVEEASGEKVLLMPPKSEIYFITTGGSELRADWIEAAEANLFGHLEENVAQRGLDHVAFDDDAEKSEELNQLLLLADTVQGSSLLHLPHKAKNTQQNVLGNNSGLTLGTDASMLKASYGADKAIFLHNFGAVESGGVQAAKWGIAILSQGAYIPNLASARGTYASVFDLESGELVSHQFVTFGDSRDPAESKSIMARVMQNLEIE